MARKGTCFSLAYLTCPVLREHYMAPTEHVVMWNKPTVSATSSPVLGTTTIFASGAYPADHRHVALANPSAPGRWIFAPAESRALSREMSWRYCCGQSALSQLVAGTVLQVEASAHEPTAAMTSMLGECGLEIRLTKRRNARPRGVVYTQINSHASRSRRFTRPRRQKSSVA